MVTPDLEWSVNAVFIILPNPHCARILWGVEQFVAWIGLEQLPWDNYLMHSHISVKELTPIVIAAAIWGKKWFGQSLQVRSDNIATVAAVISGTSHNSEAMYLLRCLSFITAKFELSFSAVHLPGRKNIIAVALSRNNLSLFYSLCPQVIHHQTNIPAALVELLVGSRPDWTSR